MKFDSSWLDCDAAVCIAEIIDLFSICFFFRFCRLFCFPSAALLGVVGGHGCVGITGSSDSVVDMAERFLFEGK